MKPTTAPSHASKLNKGKSQNRSKGKSTVNQTVSPPLRVDQVTRPMSVSPLPKEAAKLSSPNNCSFALTTSPQNNHNSNIYVSVSGEPSNSATDGSFLEVENEIEIKTELVDELANPRVVNSKQLVNGKKRPLNSNDSAATTSTTHSALTNGVTDTLPSQQGDSGGGGGDETAAKKKRFKSQEVNSSASELSFTNTDNLKTIKKSSKNLNETKGN